MCASDIYYWHKSSQLGNLIPTYAKERLGAANGLRIFPTPVCQQAANAHTELTLPGCLPLYRWGHLGMGRLCPPYCRRLGRGSPGIRTQAVGFRAHVPSHPLCPRNSKKLIHFDKSLCHLNAPQQVVLCPES